MTSFPALPDSSFTALIVMFKGSTPFHTFLSVRAVSRSFSNASLALDINSRRNMSLYTESVACQRIVIQVEMLTGESRDWSSSQRVSNAPFLTPDAYITCLWQSCADAQHRSSDVVYLSLAQHQWKQGYTDLVVMLFLEHLCRVEVLSRDIEHEEGQG